MDSDNQELTGYEQYGRLARQAYAGASLSRSQRDRHLTRLAEAGSRRQEGHERLRVHVAEIGAIAAVLIIAMGLVAVWQGLGVSSSNDAASLPTAMSGQSTAESTAESGMAVLTPTVTREGVTSEVQGSPTVTNGAGVDSCPVTPYSNGQPSGSNQAAFTDTWFGEAGGLWAGLGRENNGVWSANHSLRVMWWHAGFDSVTVTGQRLDGDAPPLEIEQRQPFHLMTFPTPGCWEVTGQASNLDLGFVVNVVPREQDPRYQQIQAEKQAVEAERQSAIPGPVPATCDVTQWMGPEHRIFSSYPEPDSKWQYTYWLDGDGIALNTRLGVLSEGENDAVWVWGTEELVPFPDEATVTAERIDGQAPPAKITFDDQQHVGVTVDDENVNLLRSTLTFPTPGCWRIQVDSDQLTFDATAFVYPADAPATPTPEADEESVGHSGRLYAIDDGDVIVLDPRSGEIAHRFDEMALGGNGVAVAVSPRGDRVAVTVNDSNGQMSIIVYRTDDWGGEHEIPVPSLVRSFVRAEPVAFSSDSRYLYVNQNEVPAGESENEGRYWIGVFDLETGDWLQDIVIPGCQTVWQMVAPGPTDLFVLCGDLVHKVDTATGEVVRSIGRQQEIASFLIRDNTVLLVSPSRTVYIYNLTDYGSEVQVVRGAEVALPERNVPVVPVTLDSSNRYLFVPTHVVQDGSIFPGGDPSEVAVIDLEQNQVERTIQTSSPFREIAFSSDGSTAFITLVGDGETVDGLDRVNLETGEETQILNGSISNLVLAD